MKRFLWLVCISSCCALTLVACGDDDDGMGGGTDGGVSNFDEVTDRLADIDTDIADLGSDLEGVSSGLDEANTAIEGLEADTKKLDTRITDIRKELDAPPGLCSADEVCMSDGVTVAEAGLAKIVTQLCTLEVECCNDDELGLKFGPGITTVEECAMTFTDLVNNGFTPSFLNANAVLVNRVLNIAQAINSNDVQVTIDPDAVDACVDHLAMRECPKYVAPGALPTHCEPLDFDAEDDPCALDTLVKGSQGLGDVCGITGIDECAAGLVCRKSAVGNSVFGLCSEPSKVGDRCRSDADCDGTEQFCNLGTGKCQERSGEGEDCEYVDPTFSSSGVSFNLNPYFNGTWQNADSVKVECKAGLTCDPTTMKCVKYCSTGSICSSSAECPEGQICNYSQVAHLWDSFELGTCGDPIALGDPCTCNLGPGGGAPCAPNDGPSKECASGRCAFDPVTDNRNECTAPLKAAGDACSLITAGVSNLDATCASNRCGTDGKCTAECTKQSDCPATHYCANTDLPFVAPPAVPWWEPTTGSKYACEPKRANDASCAADADSNRFNDLICSSGNCDGGLGLCKAKVALASACPAGQHSACMNGFCKSDGGGPPMWTCTAFVAAGGTCSGAGIGDPDCGAGAYCGNLGSNLNKCVAYVASGGTCDATTNDIRCNPTLALQCVEVGATTQCHEPGKYPVGAACDGDDAPDAMGVYKSLHGFCGSTWCRLSDYTCQTPLAAGVACDDDDPAKDHCAMGTYCNFPNLPPSASAYGEGTCTAQGTAGQPCDPRFGNDCVSPGSCTLANDTFACNSAALVTETLFCDGE